MNDRELILAILGNEVKPVKGCTEPGSVSYGCAELLRLIEKTKKRKVEIYEIKITLDPATYKVGFGVGIVGTKETGFYFAAALGVICGNPNKGLTSLEYIDELSLQKAKQMIEEGRISVKKNDKLKSFRVEIKFTTNIGNAMLLIEESHTKITKAEIDGVLVDLKAKQKYSISNVKNVPYRSILAKKTISDLAKLAREADQSIIDYVRKGVEVNLRLSKEGLNESKITMSIQGLIDLGICIKDPLTEIKMQIGSAVERRMKGLEGSLCSNAEEGSPYSSGESGNQGYAATLVAYFIGKHLKVEEDVIYRSILFSHLVNAYVKCYTGSLSSMCGCSIAAGLGAAAALVFQQDSENVEAIESAINNVISSTGGLLCEGGNEGCAAKVITAVDAVVRSAIAAVYDFNAFSNIVKTSSAKQSIINMAHIASSGMRGVDAEVNRIIDEKH